MQKLIAADGYSARDPQVIAHNGKYYRCFTRQARDVHISCADSIEALTHAPMVKVWEPESGHPWSQNVWAPELHILDGKCYIYVAADDGDKSHHRMYVLENGSSDPLQPYNLHGKLLEQADQYAIDGTVMHHNGQMYFLWSGRERDDIFIQNIYMAKMADPYTLDSARVLLSTPELPWEKLGGMGVKGRSYVNEGPYAFQVQGRQFVSYSAAGSWCEDYCIAMLELTGSDPLDPKAWVKFPEPVFSKNSVVKGAGHCSVIAETMDVFFHAWDAQEQNVVWTTAAAWHGRLTFQNGRFEVE